MRLLRGRVVIREMLPESKAGIWTPAPNPREQKTHRGVVLGLGPPMLQSFTRRDGSVIQREIPHGFVVGDVVQYHFQHNLDQATNDWTDGKAAHWIPQWCVDAVITGTDESLS